eukprot:gene13073-17523_t
MTEVDHHDVKRKSVSSTAFVVAAMRAKESERNDGNRLFNDPFAKILAGDFKMDFQNMDSSGYNKASLLNAIAVRTRKIDDYIIQETVIDRHVSQICVLGAGLDARPWRITSASLLSDYNITSLPNIHEISNITYFEVDFKEVLEYKTSIIYQYLESLEVETDVVRFAYHAVHANLGVTGWENILINEGFDINQPTLWVMEGLLNYLTKSELEAFIQTVSLQLSANNSRIIATCLTQPAKAAISLHQYIPEYPLQIFESYGWNSGLEEDIHDVGHSYSRPFEDEHSPEPYFKGYKIITVQKYANS